MAGKDRPRYDELELPFTKHIEFYEIALEGLKRAKRLEKLAERSIRKMKLTEDDKNYSARMTGFAELGSIVSVVFSALSLEAFINDYASQRLSKSYFDNYLDKLDLVSKWVVIPRSSPETSWTREATE